jgi:hypothetical protein
LYDLLDDVIFRNRKWRGWVGGVFAIALLNLGILPGLADCVPIPQGLVSWWPAEGDASDIIGTNSGALEGGATATAPGYVGNCFTFDGTNGFVQIPDSPSLKPTNLTIEAWVRFDSLDSAGAGGSPPGEQYIVFKQNTRTAFFEGYCLGKIRLASGDVLTFGVVSATGQVAQVNSTGTVTTNQWYHIAGVRGADFIQLYINGQLNGQTNAAFPPDYGTNALYFGTTGQSYWDHKLNGALDEVSLYNRVLGPDEIAAIYAAGHQGKCKTPTIISLELAPGGMQSPPFFALLTIAGLPGQPFGIQASYSSLLSSNLWIGLTNLTLPTPTTLWLDPSAATDPQRFYRAVPGSVSIP